MGNPTGLKMFHTWFTAAGPPGMKLFPRAMKYSDMAVVGPWYTAQPSARTSTFLMVSRMRKLGWWIVSTTVQARSSAIFNSICINCSATVLSNPEVGSSRNNTAGLWIKSTPIDTLLLSPPETREICKTTPKKKKQMARHMMALSFKQ